VEKEGNSDMTQANARKPFNDKAVKPTCSTQVINTNSRHSTELLERAYNEVYLRCFPQVEEQESLEDLRQYVADGDANMMIMGDNLNSKNPFITAIAITYPYGDEKKNETIGLLGYLGVRPGLRGEGLGHAMYDAFRQQMAKDAVKDGQTLAGIVHECNPVGTPDDVMDPAKRMAIYESWGCLRLPIFYKQPPLEKGKDGCELVLMVETNPVTGGYPTKQNIKDYLYGIYKEAEENADAGPPEKNKDYLRSVQELDALDLNAFYAALKSGKSTPKLSIL
jgi:hypothetical protein